MKRKYSICLGIAICITIAYVLYLGWYFFDIYTESIAKVTILQPASFPESLLLMIPHAVIVLLALIFLTISFFTSIFALVLIAGGLFCIAAIAYIPHAVFLLPSIVLTCSGSIFCFKKHKLAKEEHVESGRLQEKKSQTRIQRTVQPTYSQNEDYQQGQRMFQRTTPTIQQPSVHMNAQMYPNVQYVQDPYMPLDQSMMNAVYPNIPVQQTSWPTDPMQVQYPPNINMQGAMYPQSDPTQMYQNAQTAYANPVQMKKQMNDGYFDDFGNFHDHNENNR